jgi:ankyrin repeat protein
MLVKAGANVNTVEKFENQTPLMWAATAAKNASEMTKLLLSKGANVKARALYTDWPNQISSEPRGQYRPVGGLTALLYAARNGCYECVEALIGAGADVNVPTPEGVTPLMIALDNDHNDVAKLLLDRGANPRVADWWGRTALFITIDRKADSGGRGGVGGGGGGRGGAGGSRGAAPGVSSMDIINRLLAADVDVNAEMNMLRPSRGGNSGRFGPEQLNTGCTPLYRATETGDMEVVRALLAKGANPNINDMGFTPFLVAAGVSPGGRGGGGGGALNTTLLDLMIEHGANVNAQVTGTRTYSMRISYSTPADKEGVSALHAAVQAGRTDMVRYLLEKGANPDLVDANGRKPIDLLAAGDGGNAGARGRGAAPAPAAAGNTTGRGAGAAPVAGAAGRGAAGGGGVNPAATAEIRAMLQDASSKK